MPMRHALVLMLAMLPMPVAAGIVTSAAPDKVAVTIYRDPRRGDAAMDRRWPGGYALITETRTITVPAGASTIRFEGVADGLLPESAIVTGLPGTVREKNRDARLLSPGALVGANLMRRVTLSRTDRATGKRTETQAVLRSGPDNGVIVETAEGIEALGCAGLPEKLTYASVPEGLSAKPTLSVEAVAQQATTAAVTLTYLAEGFDWDAGYVVDLVPDKRDRADLFGWVTLANGGTTGFADAGLSLIAGDVNRTSERQASPADVAPLSLRCWPMGTTKQVGLRQSFAAVADAISAEDIGSSPDSAIIVTGMRASFGEALQRIPIAAIIVEQESLGDLKLYRVPEPVTVAAQGQKQVALVVKDGVEIERIAVARFDGKPIEDEPMERELRSRNVMAKKLGVPLPAGTTAVYATSGSARRIVIGEDRINDRAIGEEIAIGYGASPDVRWSALPQRRSTTREVWVLEISNASDQPVDAEVTIGIDVGKNPPGLVRREGLWRWVVKVPANGTAQTAVTARLVDDR